MEAAKANIKFNFKEIVDAVRQLSPTQKLELNKVIWEDESDILIPLETQQIVLDRIKKAQEHPETMIGWAEAKKSL